jgi:phenylacetate-coenzyme A ligase PaaK-like adenylate-forming protein
MLGKLYDRLPIFLQNLATTGAGMMIRRQRYSRQFFEFLARLEESDFWSLDRLIEYQDARLRDLVRHCYETVPFYRRQFDELGIRPEDIRTQSDLKHLPILTKQTVRAHRDEFLSTAPRAPSTLVDVSTSGTTGAGMTYVHEKRTVAFQWAVWWRLRRRFGVDITDWHANFGGKHIVPRDQKKPPFWRANPAMRQTYFSSFHLSERNIPFYLDRLDRGRYIWYAGYPSVISLLAEYMVDHGVRLRHPPRVVITGAETLLPTQEKVIEQAFGCPAVDTYGAAEMICNMSRCRERLYHVDMELGIIEGDVIEATDEGRVARIIATGLVDRAMPLLRYDIGDVATFVDCDCPCGRASPTAVRIEGRTEGCIRTPDGRSIGRMARIFVDLANVHESQIVQDHPDHLTVRVIRCAAYTELDERRFEQRIRDIVGPQMGITFEHVSAIPREKNGKFKAVINEVDRGGRA